MSRAPVLFFLAILGAATGIGLLMTAATLARPEPVAVLESASQRTAVTESIRHFYAAANETLWTGSTAALERVVSERYVAHWSPLPATRGVAVYGRVLTTFRTQCPDCRLSLDALVVDGDRAAAEVSVYDPSPGTYLGLRREGPWVVWSGHDVLIVEDGRVAEHWSAGQYSAGTGPLFRDVALNVPSGLAEFRAHQLTLLPGARLSGAMAPWGLELLVESGALTVHIDARTAGDHGVSGRLDGDAMVVGPRERLRLAPGAGYHLHNDTSGAIETYAAEILPLDEDGAASALSSVDRGASTAGVFKRLIAAVVVTEQPGGQIAFTLGRATLGPGGAIAASAAGEANIVMVAAGAAVFICARNKPCAALTAESPEPVVLSGDAVQTMRNEGPRPVDLFVVLLASIDPDPPAW